ncbi:MAG TPA: hypothetical protein VKZ56_05175 [Membranihabitans sp.]|nr:hypothetical protein [Membranihabitans sp.]
MVYPALVAAVSDAAHPAWRASSVGIYRFRRDIGYAVYALMAGMVAANLGLIRAVQVAGIVTFISGIVVWRKLKEILKINQYRFFRKFKI